MAVRQCLEAVPQMRSRALGQILPAPTSEAPPSPIEVPRARASRVLRLRTPVLSNTDLRWS